MTANVSKQDFQKYLGEARSWETDRVRQLVRSRKVAWIVASLSIIVALVSVLAVSALAPLKTVEPYVIRVDNATGIVEVVRAMRDSKTTYDETMNKYFIQKYIRFREGFSKELAEDYYANVGIMSSSSEQQKYLAAFEPKNPLSPLNVYGAYAKVRVSIKSVSFIRPDVALVRYVKEIDRAGVSTELSHWAATVIFKYSGAPMSERDRANNPLGFQITEYRNDPDSTVVETIPVARKVASGNSQMQPLVNGVGSVPSLAPVGAR